MTVGMPGPLAYQFQNPCLLAGKNGWGSFGISSSSMAGNSCIGGRSGSTRIAHRCRCHYTGNIGPPAWCGVQGPRQNRANREESKSEKISNLQPGTWYVACSAFCVQLRRLAPDAKPTQAWLGISIFPNFTVILKVRVLEKDTASSLILAARTSSFSLHKIFHSFRQSWLLDSAGCSPVPMEILLA